MPALQDLNCGRLNWAVSAYAVCASNELIRHVSRVPRECCMSDGRERERGWKESRKGCTIGSCTLLQWLIDLSKTEKQWKAARGNGPNGGLWLVSSSSGHWLLITSEQGQAGEHCGVCDYWTGIERMPWWTCNPTSTFPSSSSSSNVTAQWQISVCLAIVLGRGMPRGDAATAKRPSGQMTKWPNGRCRQWGLANWKCAKVHWTRSVECAWKINSLNGWTDI